MKNNNGSTQMHGTAADAQICDAQVVGWGRQAAAAASHCRLIVWSFQICFIILSFI